MGTVLDVEAAVRELKRPRIAEKSLSFFEVQSGYRPGWTLASSFVLQAGAVALITFLALIPARVDRPSRLQFVNVIDFSSPDRVIILPTVGGGSEGNRAGIPGNPGGSLTPPVHNSEGFSYPGAQPMVSDPPQAFNPTQTLLRPGMKALPALREFVALPNVVEMANAAPDAAPARIVVKPSSHVAVADAVAPDVQLPAPKLTLPVTTTGKMPSLVVPEAPATLKPVEKPVAPPVVELSEVTTTGRDAKSLLSLSAIPAPPDVPVRFPSAEARGRFAVAPDPVALASQSAPGAGSTGASTEIAGIGKSSDTGAADAVSTTAAVTGSMPGHLGSGDGNSTASRPRKGGSSGDGGTGVVTGRGSASGVGIGSGSSGSSASGAGGGGGGGSGTFAGITIQGGRYAGGTGANLHPTLAPRTAYGMTIVSTARSGGGLADFGVFANEKVYTVFMDMRESGEEHVPAWTLQYAAVSSAGGPKGEVVAPSPVIRPRPQLPAPLLHKYPHTVIVISARLDTAGYLEDISVKQTPDAKLVPAILAALSNWYFRPAEVDGQPVAIKILLGIPLL